LYKYFLLLRYAPLVGEATFRAIAEPRRRAILKLVSQQPRSVNEIAKHFDVTQQAVSQHLQVLKDAGLVAVRPEGQRRLYAVRQDGLTSVREFLEELWPQRLEELKRVVESDG
jgi:DNA-binding transcriptional ArsR family regulator